MTLETGLAARLIAGIRSQTPGATPWDAPGIAAALAQVGGTPGAAFAAAALAAEDASLVKPSAAAFRNHWPTNAGVGAPRVSYDVPCIDHPEQVHPCPRCRDEKPRLTPEAIAELRAVVAARRTPTPKHVTPKTAPDADARHEQLRQAIAQEASA